jgi:hypothetical protein
MNLKSLAKWFALNIYPDKNYASEAQKNDKNIFSDVSVSKPWLQIEKKSK